MLAFGIGASAWRSENQSTADALVVALKDAEDRVTRASTGPRYNSTSGSRLPVRLKAPARDPKKAWSKVLSQSPDALWVAPVFRDRDGNELLPTGAIGVRFRRKPSNRALEAFADDEGMELERRNEFVPEQAMFRPRRPREVYLPELVARIASRADVAAAWPATSSRYRKT
jgi:hypothetical protein